MTHLNYTQITRTKPWRPWQLVRFDSWSFGACFWRHGFSVRLFSRTFKFESRDPWNHPDDLVSRNWRVGCKRSWRRK